MIEVIYIVRHAVRIKLTSVTALHALRCFYTVVEGTLPFQAATSEPSPSLHHLRKHVACLRLRVYHMKRHPSHSHMQIFPLA